MFSSGRSKCLLLPQRESKQAAALTRIVMRKWSEVETKWKIFLTSVSKDQIAHLGLFQKLVRGPKRIFGVRWKQNRVDILTIEVFSEKTMEKREEGDEEEEDRERGHAVARSKFGSSGC